MSRGNNNFECPFGECGYITCDFMGIKHEDNVVQCPTQIFNKCQSDIELTKEDDAIIKETWEKVKEKNKVEIYKTRHHLYYPTVPSLQTKCPINYDWDNCSSKELECRTCANYNPLRMLYEETVNGINICVPREVLLDDCRVQLEKG